MQALWHSRPCASYIEQPEDIRPALERAQKKVDEGIEGAAIGFTTDAGLWSLRSYRGQARAATRTVIDGKAGGALPSRGVGGIHSTWNRKGAVGASVAVVR